MITVIYQVIVDRLIPQYIFELVKFGITMGTLSALKTTFTRVISVSWKKLKCKGVAVRSGDE